MSKHNKEKIIFLVMLIFAVAALIGVKPVYGSSIDSIQEIIVNDGEIKKPIKNIRYLDYDNYRLVGFQESDDNIGMAVFERDRNSNYLYRYLERSYKNTIGDFYVLFESNQNYQGAEVIICFNKSLYKIKRIINGSMVDCENTNSRPIVLLPTPKLLENFTTLLYFYDKKGNELD
ncbi:MAG TPA: hypothetical protein VHP31_09120 [Caproicibacter sp.]|nr:hypothetical protein [Caproicibacter sp.]